jgi:tetratricopeptide (TPR) repeat protein
MIKLNLNIAKEEYSIAIAELTKVLEYKMKKKEASRIHFVLGQLYERNENKNLAYNEYINALKGKLNDDLKFEAKLKSISLSNQSRESLLKQLNAMKRKGSYQDKVYKIYYTIGNIYYQSKDFKQAIENYSLASANAKTNQQKFLIFEQVAQMSYKRLDYITAAQYYDSALTVIPKNYPREKEIRATSKALSKLLVQYNIFIEKDSILSLVALGKEGAINKIEKQIKKEREDHTAKKEFKKTKTLNQTVTAGTWYFSDSVNVEQGKIAFQQKWGEISLQDNWKFEKGGFTITSNSSDSSNAQNPASTMSAYDIAVIEADRLPFDAEKQKPLIADIQKSIIEMARIYNFEIKDKDKAIEMYELLFEKYPNNIPNEDEALFSLFRLYADNGHLQKAKETKDLLASKYPNSKFTTYANNPNAKSGEEKANAYVEKQYKKAFKSYKNADYSQALSTCLSLIERYPDNANISKVKLLVAFIYSYTSQPERQKQALNHIATTYPKTEEGQTASAMLAILDNNGSSPKLPADQVSVANPKGMFDKKITIPNEVSKGKVIDTTKKPTKWVEEKDDTDIPSYTFDPNSSHYTMFYLTESISPNSVKTLLNVYNNTRWRSSDLSVTMKFFGVHRIILVGMFDNYQKATIYGNTARDEAMLKTLFEKSEMYTISTSNLSNLETSNKWSEYITFFNKNY